MGVTRKLRKLSREPGLFFHDLLATRVGSRDSGSLLRRALAPISVGAFLREARAHSTIAPLEKWIEARVKSAGLSSTRDAADRALRGLLSDESDLTIAENFFQAAARGFAQTSTALATDFAKAYTKGLPEQIRAFVIYLEREDKLENALDLARALGADDFVEVRVYRAALAPDHGEALTAALEAGSDAVRALLERIAASGVDPLAVSHFAFDGALGQFSMTHEVAPIVIETGEALLKKRVSDRIVNGVASAYLAEGDLAAACKLLDEHAAIYESPPLVEAKVRGLLAIGGRGFDYQPTAPIADYVPLRGRVLHVLYSSLPHHSSGYATRSHALLTGVQKHGWSVSAVTRVGYPVDLGDAWADATKLDVIDGIAYRRLGGPPISRTRLDDYLAAYADALVGACIRDDAQILHAHSNAVNGLVANRAAKALGIKSIYEVRGLWELTRVARQPSFDGSDHFGILRDLEVQACREADAVICITEGLKSEMIARGVAAEKISVVPNGVDIDRFQARPRDEALATRLGIAGRLVVGYVGSFVHYEGLDDLLQAFGILRDRGVNGFVGLLVGDGRAMPRLQRLVTELALDDFVIFTGRVPHDEVESYYSLIDVAPFPRKSFPVTEIVSPLKPFEAMAMGKTVIASDVGALVEIIVPGENGFLFAKDDPEALADCLAARLGGEGSASLAPRQWVLRNRNWSELAGRTAAVYESLTGPALDIIELPREDIHPALLEVRDAYRHFGRPELLRDADFARFSVVARTLRGGGALLDVGVGSGQFLNGLAMMHRFDRLRGVDVEKHPFFKSIGAPLEIDYCSIAELPYEDDEFDLVTCLEVIEHVREEEFARSLAELQRVSRRQLVISVPFREHVLSEGHLRRFDTGDLKRLFPDARHSVLRKGSSAGGRPTYWAMIDVTM